MDTCVIPLRFGGLSLLQTTDFFYPLVDDPYMMVNSFRACRCRVFFNHSCLGENSLRECVERYVRNGSNRMRQHADVARSQFETIRSGTGCCSSFDDTWFQGKLSGLTLRSFSGISAYSFPYFFKTITLSFAVNLKGEPHRLLQYNLQDCADVAGTSITGGQTVLNPWCLIGGVGTSVCQPNEFIMLVGSYFHNSFYILSLVEFSTLNYF